MAIGVKVMGPTALSSTSDVEIGGTKFEFPDKAQTLLKIIPVLSSPEGNTTAEPVAAKIKFTSDHFKVEPYTILCQPIGSSLSPGGALGAPQMQGPLSDVEYPVNCKVYGGAQIDATANGLFNHTIEPYVMVAYVFSDQPRQEPQRYSVVGTYTSTGASATEVAGTAYTITGGTRIKEVGGFCVMNTVTALKGLLGKIRLTSNQIHPSWDLTYPLNCGSGQVDTVIQESVAGVARWPVDLGMDNKCIIQDYFTVAVALQAATNGYWISQVAYI